MCGNTVEAVDQFCYLGSEISSSQGFLSEQVRRIGIASSAMKRLSKIWQQSSLSQATKLRLYMALIVPVPLHASETLTLSKADSARLKAFHMRCQRQILGVHWYNKRRNTEIAEQTGLEHIGTLIQRRRNSIFGHVVRMTPNAPTHKA